MKKRVLALLSCLCIMLTLLPTAALAASDAQAIRLGADGVAAGDKIYYGSYAQSDTTGVNKDPIEWRVLSTTPNGTNNGAAWSEGDGLLLLSEQTLDVKPYHTEYKSVTWGQSDLRTWMNGSFFSTAFDANEQGAVLPTTLENADNPTYHTAGGGVTTDRVFALSMDEASDARYFADNDARVAVNTGYVARLDGMSSADQADIWWLRSPGSHDSIAAGVGEAGGVFSFGFFVDSAFVAVRPALNFNPDNVLFTSAADGGKVSGALGAGALKAVSTDGRGEWKATLLDSGRSGFGITTTALTAASATIRYFGAETGNSEYLSAVIVDNGKVLYYGRIALLDGVTNGASGTATVNLPSGVTLGSDTTLRIFNEQYNGGGSDSTRRTDYASALQTVREPGSRSSSCTLTFSTNGGSGISPAYLSEYTTVDLSKYTPTRKGYAFTGWYSDKNLTAKITSICLTQNTTVYAGWKQTPDTDAWDNPFTDVSETDWFYEDVALCHALGLMKGTGDKTFSPYAAVTRGMMVTILYRFEGEPEVTGACPFADVTVGSYCEKAITWAAENGIAGGYGSGKFGPGDVLTREQMAAILYHYAKYKGYDVSVGEDTNILSYHDALTVSEYAVPAMQWACGAGLIAGRDGNLMPRGEASRCQTAAILHRFWKNIAK